MSCYAWHVETVSDRRKDSISLGDEVKVSLRDGRVVALRNAGLQQDSVVGYAMKSPERVAIAVPDVRQVQAWRFSGRRTAALFVGFSSVFLTVFVISQLQYIGAAFMPL